MVMNNPANRTWFYLRPGMLFFVSILFCVSCGFHLRGQIELPEKLSPLFLEPGTSDSDVYRELNNLFRANEIKLADSITESAASLKIIKSSESSRILSVDSRGRAREYQLNLRIEYQLKGNKISEVNKTVLLNRDLIFDPDSVLAINNERQVLYRDMNRDAARLILQQLQAFSASEDKK